MMAGVWSSWRWSALFQVSSWFCPGGDTSNTAREASWVCRYFRSSLSRYCSALHSLRWWWWWWWMVVRWSSSYQFLLLQVHDEIASHHYLDVPSTTTYSTTTYSTVTYSAMTYSTMTYSTITHSTMTYSSSFFFLLPHLVQHLLLCSFLLHSSGELSFSSVLVAALGRVTYRRSRGLGTMAQWRRVGDGRLGLQ